MRGYERRAAGVEAYYNLDAWDDRLGCWAKSKRRYESEAAARSAAKKPGRYRISRSEAGKRVEFEPFEVCKT